MLYLIPVRGQKAQIKYITTDYINYLVDGGCWESRWSTLIRGYSNDYLIPSLWLTLRGCPAVPDHIKARR